MDTIDKAQFGAFLTALRKERGLTQRALAERLSVSDKAVSKWERGQSLPDVTLLLPIARELGVTVTELLEGRRLEAVTEETAHAERLVQTALSFPGEPEGQTKARRRKRGLLWGVSAAVALLECVVLALTGWTPEQWNLSGLLVLELLALVFGCYAWVFLTERLPEHYDTYPTDYFTQGLFRLHLPGTRFTNRNWPRVVAVLRGWGMGSALLLPLLCGTARAVFPEGWLTVCWVLFMAALVGLFLPLWLAGRK